MSVFTSKMLHFLFRQVTLVKIECHIYIQQMHHDHKFNDTFYNVTYLYSMCVLCTKMPHYITLRM